MIQDAPDIGHDADCRLVRAPWRDVHHRAAPCYTRETTTMSEQYLRRRWVGVRWPYGPPGTPTTSYGKGPRARRAPDPGVRHCLTNVAVVLPRRTIFRRYVCPRYSDSVGAYADVQPRSPLRRSRKEGKRPFPIDGASPRARPVSAQRSEPSRLVRVRASQRSPASAAREAKGKPRWHDPSPILWYDERQRRAPPGG